MSSLFAHALKQEISLPVARLLVLVRTPAQVFKLATGWGLKDSHTRLSERLSGSPGVGACLPREGLLRHLAHGLSGLHRLPLSSAYSSLLVPVISL
jgi:hypothetical protein